MVVYFPAPVSGNALRNILYRFRLKGKLGKNARLGFGLWIYNDAKVEIGNYFVTGPHVIINSGGSFGIVIGNNVSVANGVVIRSASHNYFSTDEPIQKQGHIAKILLPNNAILNLNQLQLHANQLLTAKKDAVMILTKVFAWKTLLRKHAGQIMASGAKVLTVQFLNAN